MTTTSESTLYPSLINGKEVQRQVEQEDDKLLMTLSFEDVAYIFFRKDFPEKKIDLLVQIYTGLTPHSEKKYGLTHQLTQKLESFTLFLLNDFFTSTAMAGIQENLRKRLILFSHQQEQDTGTDLLYLKALKDLHALGLSDTELVTLITNTAAQAKHPNWPDQPDACPLWAAALGCTVSPISYQPLLTQAFMLGMDYAPFDKIPQVEQAAKSIEAWHQRNTHLRQALYTIERGDPQKNPPLFTPDYILSVGGEEFLKIKREAHGLVAQQVNYILFIEGKSIVVKNLFPRQQQLVENLYKRLQGARVGTQVKWGDLICKLVP